VQPRAKLGPKFSLASHRNSLATDAANKGILFIYSCIKPAKLHQNLEAAAPTVTTITCILDQILQNPQQSVTATASHKLGRPKCSQEIVVVVIVVN
jgi:hypothetical protein